MKLWERLTKLVKDKPATTANEALVEKLNDWQPVGKDVIHAETVWNNEQTRGTHLDGRFLSRVAIYKGISGNYISVQTRQSDGRVYFVLPDMLKNPLPLLTEVEQFSSLEPAIEWLFECKLVKESSILESLLRDEIERHERGDPPPRYPYTRKLEGNVGDLFVPEPQQWGLRGDPYLWREMQSSLSEVALPMSYEDVDWRIKSQFFDITGKALKEAEAPIIIERYHQGGMSSGQVSPEFWSTTALPELLSRYKKERDKQLGTTE